MSSMDQMKDDSLILSETMRRISLRPSRFRQILNTKSSSLTKLTTQPQMYNSVLGRLLRSSLAIADSSSPATTKTKSLNLSIPVVLSLNLESVENKNNSLPHNFSSDSKKFWDLSTLNMTTKLSSNSSTNTSQTGEESLTNAKDTPFLGRLIRAFSQRFRTFQ